jgi:GT2 family glycosyltransferase
VLVARCGAELFSALSARSGGSPHPMMQTSDPSQGDERPDPRRVRATGRFGPDALWVARCEVSEGWRLQPVNDDPPALYTRARALVRLGHRPLGFAVVPLVDGSADPEEVERAVRPFLDGLDEGNSPPAASMGVPSASAPSAAGERVADLDTTEADTTEVDSTAAGTTRAFTVAICTRDRPELAVRCLLTARELDYPNFDVLVVDNAPSDEATRDAVEELALADPRIHYVREPRPGLSNARNRALHEASREYVAFTDDDVIIDPWWLRGLARGFQAAPGVACVTGLVPVARLATPEERYFDARVSWSDRMQPALFDLEGQEEPSVLFPYKAGVFGTGANFAVDREHIVSLGGFDPHLGTGSPTSGGEDLDAFVRILRSSRALAYEPSAVIWHFHRTDASGLRHQMRDYGRGLAAVITKWLIQDDTRREVVRKAPAALRHLWSMWAQSATQRPVGSSRAVRFTAEEVAGALSGPVRYYRACRSDPRPPVPWRQ